MKKYLSLALALAMLVSSAALASCGDDSTNTTAASNNSQAPASSNNAGGESSGTPTDSTPEDTDNPAAPTTPVEEDPTLKAYNDYMASLRKFTDAEVANEDEFKADPNNQNLMTDYFDAFNFEYSIYAGFVYDPEDPDNGDLGNEEAPNIFDGVQETKWCGSAMENEFTNAIVWSMTDLVNVTGYAFVSGNDNVDYKDRNPITWRLFGATELPTERMDTEQDEVGNTHFDYFTAPEGWVLLDGVDAQDYESTEPNPQSLLPDLNFEETIISLPNPGQYKYFMLMIDTNETNCIQISDFILYGSVVTE